MSSVNKVILVGNLGKDIPGISGIVRAPDLIIGGGKDDLIRVIVRRDGDVYYRTDTIGLLQDLPLHAGIGGLEDGIKIIIQILGRNIEGLIGGEVRGYGYGQKLTV